jgi:DNA-directed RNA polymerase specialized sigma24 family protein
MTTDEAAELRRRLDCLIALALCQLEHRADPNDVIEVFSRFAIPPSEVAAMLGMSPNAVRIARHRIKRKGKRVGPRKT